MSETEKENTIVVMLTYVDLGCIDFFLITLERKLAIVSLTFRGQSFLGIVNDHQYFDYKTVGEVLNMYYTFHLFPQIHKIYPFKCVI